MIDRIGTSRDVAIPARTVRPTLEMVLAMYQSAACRVPVDWPMQDDPTVWQVKSRNRQAGESFDQRFAGRPPLWRATQPGYNQKLWSKTSSSRLFPASTGR